MAITVEDVEREKQALPFGYGRFGKALERLAEISEPDESLLVSLVAISPEYRPRFVPGTALSTVHSLTTTTNIVLACTDRRLIGIGTGVAGGPRDHISIPYEGLEIEPVAKRAFVLRWPEGHMKVRGFAKQQGPAFLEALATQARPATPVQPS